MYLAKTLPTQRWRHENGEFGPASADFILRFIAALLDFSIVSLTIPFFLNLSKQLSGNVALYFASESLIGEGISEELLAASIAAMAIALSISVFAWFLGTSLFLAICESVFGSSPGKYLLGLRVQGPHGNRPSLFRSSLRQTSKGLSALILGFGFLLPLWTKRRQALHDKIAACVVVRINRTSSISWFFCLGLSTVILWISFPIIQRKAEIFTRPIQHAVRIYQAPGFIERTAWALVVEGWKQLQDEKLFSHRTTEEQ